MAQQLFDPACGLTLDDHHRIVKSMLPRGRAWPDDDSSVLQKFWRAFSGTVKAFEDRICDFAGELFCSSANESLPTWMEQYGLPDECDPNGDNLCARVAMQGGSTCEYFTDVAHLMGYEVSCEKPPSTSETVTIGGSNLGYIYVGSCPTTPPVGSELGQLPLGPDCCNIAGYGESVAPPVVGHLPSACSDGSVDLPATQPFPGIGPAICGWYSEEPYTYDADAYRWGLVVSTGSAGSCQYSCSDLIYVGDTDGAMTGLPLGVSVHPIDSPLCSVDFNQVFCWIERFKPAHTEVTFSVA
jgi:uncharacterized protein YmfQ (DUF2313 family)